MNKKEIKKAFGLIMDEGCGGGSCTHKEWIEAWAHLIEAKQIEIRNRAMFRKDMPGNFGFMGIVFPELEAILKAKNLI